MNTLEFLDLKINMVDEPEIASEKRTELKSDPNSPLREFERLDVKINMVDEDEETSNVSTELRTEQDSPFETLSNMEYNPHLLNNLLEDLL